MSCEPEYQGSRRFLQQTPWETNGGTFIPALDGYGIASAHARQARDERRVSEKLEEEYRLQLIQEHRHKQARVNAMYTGSLPEDVPQLQYREPRCRMDKDGFTHYYYVDQHGKRIN